MPAHSSRPGAAGLSPGAEREGLASGRSGPLKLKDLYSLHLDPDALVVLSSCETALGPLHPGKEVVSLASAFRAAGAARIVSTLWQIDDEGSVAFCEAFYRRLVAGDGVAVALNQARREMIRASRHPFYWGAFKLEAQLPGL